MHRAFAMVVLVFVAGGSACGATEPTIAYVGALASTDATVAVATTTTEFAVYVCGGPTTVNSLTHWFSGTLTAQGTVLHATNGAWAVSGTLGANAWSGTLTSPDGTMSTWSVAAARADTLAGLYAVANSGCRTGVVVVQGSPGDTATAQGAWCNTMGEFEQVTPIQPLSLSPMGLYVRVSTASGIVHDLFAQRVTLPLP